MIPTRDRGVVPTATVVRRRDDTLHRAGRLVPRPVPCSVTAAPDGPQSLARRQLGWRYRGQTGFVYTRPSLAPPRPGWSRPASILWIGVGHWDAATAIQRIMSLWTRAENDNLVSLLLRWAHTDDDALVTEIAGFLFDRALPPLSRALRERGFSAADAEDIGQELLAQVCERESLAGLAVALGLAEPAGTAWAEVFGWTSAGRVESPDVLAYRFNYLAKSLRRARWNEISAEKDYRERSRDGRRDAAATNPSNLDPSTRLDEAHRAGLGDGPSDLLRLDATEAEREAADQAAAKAARELAAIRWVCARLTEILESILEPTVYSMVRLKYVRGHDAPRIAEAVWGSSARRFADQVRQTLSRKVNQSSKLLAAIRAFGDRLDGDHRRVFERMRRGADPDNESEGLQTMLTVWGRTERGPGT